MENINEYNLSCEQPLTKIELLDAIQNSNNNKSTSFDCVSNEMIKASMTTLLDPIVELFSTMIKCSLYSKYWKEDILNPIHKKGVKDDPNNYMGDSKVIRPEQISGRKASISADHLMVVRFLIEKYALNRRKNSLLVSFTSKKLLT